MPGRGVGCVRVLMLFLDGVGIGRRDAEVNPFFAARLPALRSVLGGELPSLRRRRLSSPHALSGPRDATLGVPGLPQSGTGPGRGRGIKPGDQDIGLAGGLLGALSCTPRPKVGFAEPHLCPRTSGPGAQGVVAPCQATRPSPFFSAAPVPGHSRFPKPRLRDALQTSLWRSDR